MRSFTSTRNRLTTKKLADKPPNARKTQTESRIAIRNPLRITTVPCCPVGEGSKLLPPLQLRSRRIHLKELALVTGRRTWLRDLLTLRPRLRWENLGPVLGRVWLVPARPGLENPVERMIW